MNLRSATALLVVAACHSAPSKPPSTLYGPVTLHGVAHEAKGGTVLDADDGRTIRIAVDLGALERKRVVASGVLERREGFECKSEPDTCEELQGIVGPYWAMRDVDVRAENAPTVATHDLAPPDCPEGMERVDGGPCECPRGWETSPLGTSCRQRGSHRDCPPGHQGWTELTPFGTREWCE